MPFDSPSAPQAYLPLAEIALNAAIELEQQDLASSSKNWLKKLADALSNEFDEDLGLVAVYDKALASTGVGRPSSKADLYAKLNEIKKRLSDLNISSEKEKNIILRDFCVALHDGLLNEGYQTHYRSVGGARFLP